MTPPAAGDPTGPTAPPAPSADPTSVTEAEPSAVPAPSAPDGRLGPEELAVIAARSGTRRAPRVARFIWAGALVGVLLAAVAAVFGPDGEVLGRGAIFLLLAVFLGSAGALIGALGAVWADRRSLRASAVGAPPAAGRPVPPSTGR